MKKLIFLLPLILLVGCTNSNDAYVDSKEKLITEKTTQYFTDEKLPDEDINKILEAGRNATSAMNSQNWYFSAITNTDLLNEFKEKTMANMPPQMKEQKNSKAQFGSSPLAIVVSCKERGEYDAGLASQNMFDYAIMLGYGAKIVSSPCRMINSEYKNKLNIPSDMNAVAVVLIGKVRDVEGYDAITSATTRKPLDEISTIIK